MTVVVSGSNITFNDSSVQDTAATGFGFKNRILNGNMVLDQRNAGASVTISTSGVYALDRWKNRANGGGAFSVQQSSTAPAGFNTAVVYTVTTADSSIAAGDNYYFFQDIEGYNVADLGLGTANAQTITMSFWVRSSVTGTYSVFLSNGTTYNRGYVATYTINAANTWEQKSVTIAGDTTGTWGKTNGGGLSAGFNLGAGTDYQTTAGAWGSAFVQATSGTTQWISNAGATFYITGVQLEKGSTATSFDYRPYGTELALCQRYCYMFQNPTGASGDGSTFGAGYTDSSSQGVYFITFPVSMRTTPSLTTVSTASGIEQAYYNGTVTTHNPTSISLISNVSSPNGALMLVGGASFSNGTGAFLRYATQSITPCVFVSAEL
tara:strand:- start:13231 stop:14367 length:1137 start_codon:yes stop_codon:yes gene_type:complete